MLFLNVRNVQYNIEFCVLTYQYEHLWYRVLPSDTHARPNVSVHSDVWAVSQRHAAGGIVRPTLRVLTRGRRSSFFLYHFYFPAQLVGGFTLSDLLDKPWSQVGVIPSPPRYVLSIFSAHRVQHSDCSSIFIECC